MYCPNCGNKSSVEQKFCRSCGIGLEKVAHALTEQLPAETDESVLAQKQKLERAGVALLGVFGVGVLSAILYGIVYRVMIVEGRIWEGAMLLVFITLISSALFAVYLFARAGELEESRAKRRAPQTPTELPQGAETATAKLISEGTLDPVPSVTEQTTEPLLAEKRGSAQGN
jgi:hypothetical protein